MDWIIRQTWRDVLMVHHRMDSMELQTHIPFPLDLFQGSAVISIVPFRMTDIRFPFTPSVPLISSLWELNLRTYVRVGDQTGVFFMTLDSDSALGVWIARHCFSLPYRKVLLSGKASSLEYSMKSAHPDYPFQMSTQYAPALATEQELELNRWATERYQLFTKKKEQVFCGRVKHEPWKLLPVKLDCFDESLSKMVGLLHPVRSNTGFYQSSIQVQFSRFQRIQ